MDDLYDNLDNYSEETTIAELREENKDLKLKIEEYAVTLEKLQKELDMLTSEHKKLEANYSSLLKTARSEIERKTQIITKLNIEKDAMVLNSIQNRNIPHNRRKDKQMNNMGESKFGKQTVVGNETSWKPSVPHQVPNERKEDNVMPIEIENVSAPIRNLILDIDNNATGSPIMNSAKNIEVKENIKLKDAERQNIKLKDAERQNIKLKDAERQSIKHKDAERPRARISDRRKSMPVFSMDCAKFSTDEDELASTESCKELISKEPERRNLDRFNNDFKISGYHESSRETRSRNSKQYDNNKHRGRDKYEASQRYRRNHSSERNRKGSPNRRKGSPERRRGSPERKKSSPDRNKKGSRDHNEDFFQRQEYDRRRRLVSPHTDKYNDNKHRSKDSQRSNDRNHQEFEKYASRSQNMYTMKHKMPHDYEEPSKRMRLDSHHKHEEERWRNERQVVPEPLDFDHLHDMSCQSPEYSLSEAQPSHLIREIKLNATAKLDDPRISSKKYSLKTFDGRTELSTVGSANIDVKVIDTTEWSMVKKMKMPDALLQKPVSTVVVGLRKPTSTDSPHALIERPISTEISHALVQKPKSSDMLDALPQKSKSTNKLDVLVQKPISLDMPDDLSQKLISTDKPGALAQNPKSTDVLHDLDEQPKSANMTDASIKKPVATDMPDILIENPGSTVTLMQDTSINKPKSFDDLVKEIYMDIENPITNMSMESGEIYDGVETHVSQDANTKKKIENTRQQVVEQQKYENGASKLSNYKIPKKSSDVIHSAKISKDVLVKHKEKINDSIKATSETAKKHDKSPGQNKRKVPQRRSSDFQYEFQNYVSTKEMIEGDLELSDEDHTDIKIIKPTQISDDKQDTHNKNARYDSADKKMPESKPAEQTKFEIDESNLVKQNMEEKSKETKITDKKPKAKKKSLKLKHTKVPNEDQDVALSVDKPGQRKEKTTKETCEHNDTLSLDLLVKIKENITKELLENEDTILSVDKPVQKKEKKTKVTSENKSTALSIEKQVKKNENKPRETTENEDIPLPMDQKVNKKDSKSKEALETKDTVSVDKPVKKKEIKTKESHERKNVLSVDKPGKKKHNKPKDSSENTELAASTTGKQVKRKDKECKAKETKFSELFGDSSSLVSPEDLGLVPAIVPQENYVAIFEDAQDAIQVNSIRAPVAVESTEILNKADTRSNFGMNFESTKTAFITDEPKLNTQEPVKESLQAESMLIQNIYQNLQPETSPEEKNSVKTIIISTGIQPQCTLEATEANPSVNDRSEGDLHVMQCVKPTVLKGVVMQALATSTPQKIWQQNIVQAELDPTVLNSRCDSSESRDASVDKNSAADNSDNTNNIQTNGADEPDVRIFVKRRRKVLKKK